VEAEVRQAIAARGWRVWFEVEIRHPDGMPQFLDVLTLVPGLGLLAIEIDGSNGWHFTETTSGGSNHSMAWYDGRKVELLRSRGIPILFFPARLARARNALAMRLDDLALAGARQGALL